jgi:hypothetical protein
MFGINGSNSGIPAAKFPVSKIQLGRDLGAAIDIGPAMTRKILKKMEW